VFFKNKKQEGKTDPIWGLVPVGGGTCKERVKAAECSVLLYENGKMQQVETIPEMGDGKGK
jgi:hypothetical protein